MFNGFSTLSHLLQRDRRHRDAPGGTRNIQKIYRWEGGQRTSKFRALLPLANNMDPYILGDFKELQVCHLNLLLRHALLLKLCSAFILLHSGSFCALMKMHGKPKS